MSEPTPPRWPALLGLRVTLKRLACKARRSVSRETWGDPALLPLAFVSPFVLVLAALRDVGHEAAGTEPDPRSLVERFFKEKAAGHEAIAGTAFVVWSGLLLFGAFSLLLWGLGALFGGAP